jgi:hypothetical protein
MHYVGDRRRHLRRRTVRASNRSIAAVSVMISLGFGVLAGLPAQSTSRWRLPLVTAHGR